jgi:hypothetical protein
MPDQAAEGTVAAPSSVDRAYAVARQRLDAALACLRGLGATADGDVGDPDVMVAVRLALGRFEADEVIVSTLSRGLSTWLHLDVPARIHRSSKLPVTHLTGQATDHCDRSLVVVTDQRDAAPGADSDPA